MNKLGTYIKELRTNKGLTQEQLAKEFNVSRQTLSSWERGKSLPDVDMITKISSYFNIPIDKLLVGHINDVDNSFRKFKILIYLIIAFLTVISSVFIYNKIYPQYKLDIQEYKGECEIPYYPLTKDVVQIGSSRYYYTINKEIEVTYDFGTYCVPVTFMFSEFEGRAIDHRYDVDTSIPVGFTLENPNSYVIFGKTDDSNYGYTLIYNMNITVIDEASNKYYRIPVKGTLQFPSGITNIR